MKLKVTWRHVGWAIRKHDNKMKKEIMAKEKLKGAEKSGKQKIIM